MTLRPISRVSALTKPGRRPRRRARLFGAIGAAALLAIAALPAVATAHDDGGSRYLQHNLVSDVPGMAAMTDPNLVNAWGMSYGPATPIWVSDNGADVATLYRGDTPGVPFAAVPLVVHIPGGAPTGQVFNPTTGFVVSNGAASGAARFIFASENGMITGWNPAVPPPPLSMWAQPAVNMPTAVFKGLALWSGTSGTFIYAADFHNDAIDVFDMNWTQQHWAGAFMDSHIPAGYAPFNIENLGGMLYVTYAKQDAARHDDVAGVGHGFVDVYSASGHLLKRLVRRGQLDSPWGLAIAPMGFGRFSGDLLVGNFGNGRINAYSPRSGEFEGTLMRASGKPVHIDGLWGLMFGNGVAATPQTLIFSAGPDGEAHGLVGTLTLAPKDSH